MFFKDNQEIKLFISCQQYAHKEYMVKSSIVGISCQETSLFCSRHHDADGDPTVALLNLDNTCLKNSIVKNLRSNEGNVTLSELFKKFEKERKRGYRCLEKDMDTVIPKSTHFDKLVIIEE